MRHQRHVVGLVDGQSSVALQARVGGIFRPQGLAVSRKRADPNGGGGEIRHEAVPGQIEAAVRCDRYAGAVDQQIRGLAGVEGSPERRAIAVIDPRLDGAGPIRPEPGHNRLTGSVARDAWKQQRIT